MYTMMKNDAILFPRAEIFINLHPREFLHENQKLQAMIPCIF
jgi:hypothetical protein